MPEKLTDAIVKCLPSPAKGNRITYDSEMKGFGCRVTAAGARSFILNYRTRTGRERRYTIGSWPEWKTVAARSEAGELKKRIDLGDDPLEEIETERRAPTVADLCERFLEEYVPRKRPSTQRDYRQQIAVDILPAIGRLKVAAVAFADVDSLHYKISARAPTHANRVVACLSRMFSLAISWGWRTDNPCRSVERNLENKRTRYLTNDEFGRLSAALTELNDRQAANVVRLLLLTGARRGELLAARWDDFDLAVGIWTKPGSTTKQKTIHRVPLSVPARELLSEMFNLAGDAPWLFPTRSGEHRTDIDDAWNTLRKAANLHDVRLHDLRHSFASILASAGLSLPVIGALLGHATPATTHRYTHLFDDPLRAATERVGEIITRRS